ncbi:hypothetical protein [Hyalangium gracile]|uniref:hypothetical protein n=1 Tax=Hyalangium gracile TaxID=394092 RepID=UPI001CCA3E28|nr:hypothetical protein [Hyalangium gracile]
MKVDARQQPYEIDGVLLEAIDIAVNDFLPPGDSEIPCERRKESYRYRIFRQGDVVFVEIMEDPSRCGSQYPSLDSGAAYAVTTDGRILRRLFGSRMGELLGAPSTGRASSVPASEAGGSQEHFDGLSPYLPLEWQDAGPRPSTPDGGPSTQDGGAVGELSDGGRR